MYISVDAEKIFDVIQQSNVENKIKLKVSYYLILNYIEGSGI
jgi:hypothetical protein